MLRKITGAATLAALALGVPAGPAGAEVSKVQEARFAALRHAPSPSVPAAVKRFVEQSDSEGLGIDVSETRRLSAPDGGQWDVIPGAAGICLFAESEQTGTCASTGDALAGRLSMQFIVPGPERPRPGLPFTIPTTTPRFQAGLLPDEAVSMTAASTSSDPLKARPGSDGLYRLSSRTGAIGTVTMHRAGKRSLKVTAAREHPMGPIKARKATCTPGVNCFCDSIPQGYGNTCFYGTAYNFAFFGAQWGRWVQVRSVQVFSADTNTICGNAINQNQTWAGNFFCNSGSWLTVHQYNGSTRIAYAGPGAPSASVLGKAYYEFN